MRLEEVREPAAALRPPPAVQLGRVPGGVRDQRDLRVPARILLQARQGAAELQRHMPRQRILLRAQPVAGVHQRLVITS